MPTFEAQLLRDRSENAPMTRIGGSPLSGPREVAQAEVTPAETARTGSEARGSADQLALSPTARALSTARTYAETAGSKLRSREKMAIFRDRFREDTDFRDPIFGHLEGRQVFGKLKVEHTGGADIRYRPVSDSDLRPMTREEIAKIDPGAAERGEAWTMASLQWDADYKLGGRPIHNDVKTTLAIDAEGKIRAQVDDYDWKKWMDQAAPFLPAMLRHSPVVKGVANFALGILTHFQG